MRHAADSAVEKWLAKYGGRFLEKGDDRVVRFDTILSMLKSDSLPYLPDVLREGMKAWLSIGRDPNEFRDMVYEAGDVLAGPNSMKVGRAID